MKSLVVLACGNTLRGDDGVAWHIGFKLQDELASSEVQIILTQQLLPEHAESLSKAYNAIFLDCSAIAQPGVVSTHTLFAAQDLPRIFTHHFDPASLLKLTHDLYGQIPSHAVSITIGGECFELQEQLSKPVAAAIPLALEAIRHVYQCF